MGFAIKSSVDTADNKTNEQIYNSDSLLIAQNTILCFIATKKLWSRMFLCEQFKRYYTHKDIVKAYNNVIELFDAR